MKDQKKIQTHENNLSENNQIYCLVSNQLKRFTLELPK